MKGVTFVIATNNAGKLREMKEILRAVGCDCVSLTEAGIDTDVEETGTTFAQNAAIKAKAIYDICKRPVIADDSGLCVDALGGQPGVRTARYAGDGHDSEANIDKLLAALKGVPLPRRKARFVSAIHAIVDDDTEYTATGTCEGFVGTERRGRGGFGYDPVFWQAGNRSIAEIPPEKKNQVSHRARAIKKLAFKLRGITKYRSYDDK